MRPWSSSRTASAAWVVVWRNGLQAGSMYNLLHNPSTYLLGILGLVAFGGEHGKASRHWPELVGEM